MVQVPDPWFAAPRKDGMSYPFGETEFKVENESVFSLSRETGKVTPWKGIRIRWRFVGERKWREIILVPDEGQDQTPETLKQNAGEVVEILAGEAARSSMESDE